MRDERPQTVTRNPRQSLPKHIAGPRVRPTTTYSAMEGAASRVKQDMGGAFVEHCDLKLAGGSSGPLTGLTFGVKDLYDVKGMSQVRVYLHVTLKLYILKR